MNNSVATTDKNSKFRPLQSILKNPTDRAKLNNLVDEAVRCKQRIFLEQETIKQLRETAKTDLEMNPKLFNAHVAASYNNDYTSRRDSAAEIVELMDNVIGILPADNSNHVNDD